MADFDALMKGTQMLREGFQTFARARATNQAQEELNALQGMEMDEAKKRQQQQLIAQNLVMNLSKAGVDPSAANALMPQRLDQTDQFITQNRADELGERQTNRDWQSKENALNRAAQRDLLDQRQSTPKIKPLSDKHIDELSGLEDDYSLGKSLMDELDKDANLVGPLFGRPNARGVVDPKFSSFKQAVDAWYFQYQKNISGAAVSDEERKLLQENRPNVKDSASQFKAKVQRILQVGQDVRQRKIRTLQKAGRDVSQFESEMATGPTAPTAPAAAPASATSGFNKYWKQK